MGGGEKVEKKENFGKFPKPHTRSAQKFFPPLFFKKKIFFPLQKHPQKNGVQKKHTTFFKKRGEKKSPPLLGGEKKKTGRPHRPAPRQNGMDLIFKKEEKRKKILL